MEIGIVRVVGILEIGIVGVVGILEIGIVGVVGVEVRIVRIVGILEIGIVGILKIGIVGILEIGIVGVVGIEVRIVGILEIGIVGILKIGIVGILEIGIVGILEIGIVGILKIGIVGILKIGIVGILKIGIVGVVGVEVRIVGILEIGVVGILKIRIVGVVVTWQTIDCNRIRVEQNRSRCRTAHIRVSSERQAISTRNFHKSAVIYPPRHCRPRKQRRIVRPHDDLSAITRFECISEEGTERIDKRKLRCGEISRTANVSPKEDTSAVVCSRCIERPVNCSNAISKNSNRSRIRDIDRSRNDRRTHSRIHAHCRSI